MKNFSRFNFRLMVALLCLSATSVMAQGVGPNINFLTPAGLKTVSISYLEADTNFRLGQVGFDELEINTQTSSANFYYRFAWMDRLALIGFGLAHIDIDSRALIVDPEMPRDIELSARTHGFGDPFLSFRMGLIGTPALTGSEWLAYKQDFQLSAQINWLLPLGDYTPTRALNPGFNRHAVDLSLPMVLPVDGARRTTFLEFTPQVRIFGDNDDPFGSARNLEQDPLYLAEVQVSHHIRGRFWLALGAQYQNGGATQADGRPRAEALDQWYGEAALGAVLNKRLSLAVTYGRIFAQANNARGDVYRVRLGIIL